MANQSRTLSEQFERLELKSAMFGHADHVQVAFEMLCRYDFVDASAVYAKTIQKMAIAAGAPEKFNATITGAFISLIAERKSKGGEKDYAKFKKENGDLFKKEILNEWYTEERLMSERARSQFLLPDKKGGVRNDDENL